MAKISRRATPKATSAEYWDACVFLDLLKQEDDERGVVAASLWDDAKLGNRVIYTSEITIAEVAYIAAANGHDLTPEDEAKIDAAWNEKCIRFVALTKQIALRARQLKRVFRAHKPEAIPLSAMDAIHLATGVHLVEAQNVTLKHFFTTDEFKKPEKTKKPWLDDQRKHVGDIVKFKVCTPNDVGVMKLPHPGGPKSAEDE